MSHDDSTRSMGSGEAFDAALDLIKARQKAQGKAIAGVRNILTSAGVHQTKIDELAANPSSVAQIEAHPELAQLYASRFPSTYINSYYDVEQKLGFATQLPGATAFSSQPGFYFDAPSFETSDTGGLRFPNGVLVDPTSRTVLFPNDPSVAGSNPWLQKVSQWNDKKVDHWRNILAKNGYIENAKGGKDSTFYEALRTFHENLYLYGGGKDVVGGALDDTGLSPGAQATEAYDPLQMKNDIRNAFREGIGDDPTEEELEALYKPMRRTVVRAIARGATPQHAALKGVEQGRVDFEASPAGQLEQRRSDAQGLENTDLMDSFVSLGQLMS